jgi:hypothetical protein
MQARRLVRHLAAALLLMVSSPALAQDRDDPDAAGTAAAQPDPDREPEASATEEGPDEPLPEDERASESPAGGGVVAGGADDLEEEEAPEKDDSDPLQGSFELTPRGIISINTAWSDRPLVPGPFAFYVAPPAFERSQYVLSPANSVFGFTVKGVSFRGWEIIGALYVTLKSPQPESRIVLAPLFYDVHVGISTDDTYIVLGQFPDVLFPFAPATINGFPGGYMPGAFGFYRPQIRAGKRIDLTPSLDVRVHGSVGRDVQNFRLTPLTIGAGGGVPDVQGRISIAGGEKQPEGLRRWQRQYQLGFSGHIGRRRFSALENELPIETVTHETWSVGIDLQAELPTGTTVRGRLWRGRVVGDYQAAVFQSVGLGTLEAVTATGGWVDLQQGVSEKWTAAVGYGRDDPEDGPLTPGQRELNEMAFAQLQWRWSRTISFAVEGSHWNTAWVGQGENDTLRVELNTAIKF